MLKASASLIVILKKFWSANKMTEKDDNCYTPCDTDTLMEKDIVGSREKGKPVNINVKGRLQKQIAVSSAV